MRIFEEDPIDRLLEEDGERWREGLAPNKSIDLSSITRSSKRASWNLAALGTVSALVVGAMIIVVVAAQLSQRRPDAGIGAGPSPSPVSSAALASAFVTPVPSLTATTAIPTDVPLDEIVRPGDEVVAAGNIIEDAEGSLTLCPTEPSRVPLPERPPVCFGPPGVHVVGVDAHSLAGSTHGGRWVTEFVTVGGIWEGGSISVSTVTPTEQPSLALTHVVPCDAPIGGWPGFGDDPNAVVTAEQRLRAELADNPDLYGGLWLAKTTELDAGHPEKVLVVGTVGDVGPVATKLHELYPFSLCITNVAFSTPELDEVAHRLAAVADNHWVADVDPAENRVSIAVTVLDEPVAGALASEVERIVVRPLVHKVTPSE